LFDLFFGRALADTQSLVKILCHRVLRVLSKLRLCCCTAYHTSYSSPFISIVWLAVTRVNESRGFLRHYLRLKNPVECQSPGTEKAAQNVLRGLFYMLLC